MAETVIKLESKVKPENGEKWFYVTVGYVCVIATMDEEKAREVYENVTGDPQFYEYKLILSKTITE